MKDNSAFWNMWTNKFKGYKSESVIVGGTDDDETIANKFEVFFSSIRIQIFI
jgi:hypothetical protein